MVEDGTALAVEAICYGLYIQIGPWRENSAILLVLQIFQGIVSLGDKSYIMIMKRPVYFFDVRAGRFFKQSLTPQQVVLGAKVLENCMIKWLGADHYFNEKQG